MLIEETVTASSGPMRGSLGKCSLLGNLCGVKLKERKTPCCMYVSDSEEFLATKFDFSLIRILILLTEGIDFKFE